MRISAKTKNEYAALKFKSGLKPVEGGWLERGLMTAMQQSRHWPEWVKRAADEPTDAWHNLRCGFEP